MPGNELKSEFGRRLEFRSAHLCQDDRPRALLLRPRILRALRDPGDQRMNSDDHLFRVLSEALFRLHHLRFLRYDSRFRR